MSDTARVVGILIDELHQGGGTELSLLALAKGLAASGRWRPAIIVLGRDALVPRFEEAGLTIVREPVKRALGPSAFDAIRRLTQALRTAGADLVHTVHTAADLLGPIAGHRLGLPVLSNRRDLGFTKARRHLLAQRWVNRWVDHVACVSEAALEAAATAEGWRDRVRLSVIDNGIDLSVFGPAPAPDAELRATLGLPPDRPVVGYLGSLHPRKGPDVLLDALTNWPAEPAPAALFVGSGEEIEALRSRAGEQGLADRVRFVSQRDDIPALLRGAMDVFALPSRTEGLSNSLLEAMATGLPVVATAVGGSQIALEGAEAGGIVPPDDAGALREALLPLVSDPEAARVAGAAARRRAEARYSVETMIGRYEELYDRLAG